MMRLLSEPFRLLWNERHLAAQFSQRVILQRTRGSFLGFIWQIVTPLIMMVLYTFIFGILLGGSFHPERDESSILYGLGIYLGLALLNLFTETFNQGPQAILSHANLVKKVIFPLPLLPLSYLAAALVPAGVSLLLATGAILYMTGTVPAGIGWIPVIWLPLIFTAAGIGWILSALSVYFRDLNQVTPIISQLAFWISGIFFPASALWEFPLIWDILKWNPILQAIEQMRNVLLWQNPVEGMWVAYLYILGFATFYAGFFLFQGLRKGFADIL